MEFITKYYGVDWIIFALLSTHIYLLGKKKRSAFIFGILTALFSIVLGFMTKSLALLIMNVTFVLLHIKAYKMWEED